MQKHEMCAQKVSKMLNLCAKMQNSPKLKKYAKICQNKKHPKKGKIRNPPKTCQNKKF